MDLVLAILWSVALIVDIASWAAGYSPTWTLVFCPLIILVCDKWEQYFKNK